MEIAFAGVAHIHTPNFIKIIQQRSDVKVKFVWDAQAERASRAAKELDAEFIEDFSEFQTVSTKTKIDAWIITSETKLHQQIVSAAVEIGIPIFIEKPLGMNAQDAWLIAKKIQDAKLQFQTGFFMRSSPVIQQLRQWIQSGLLGEITRVRASNCHKGALGGWFDSDYRWMADPKQAGCGAFGDLGAHVMDILIWIFGPVKEATASIGSVLNRYEGCDEFGEGLMRFENGVIGTLASGWVDVANPISFLVSGTEGHASIIRGELFIKSDKLAQEGDIPWKELPPAKAHAFELFLDALEGKESFLVPVTEAAAGVAAIDAMYQGARENRWVQVSQAI